MTSYEYFKKGGARELQFNQLPKNYGWVTSCGGDGWYWNFFATDSQLEKDYGRPLNPKEVIMCKIKPL
jgi:hypothetical protein